MLGLITDRTQDNVDYLASLNRKGWEQMTPYEKAIWTGDPLTASDFGYREPVNLIPNRVDHSTGPQVVFRNKYFVTNTNGTVAIVIGAADDFTGKVVTLSVGAISGSGRMSLVWYNSVFDFKGIPGVLTGEGSTTTTLDVNSGGYGHLALIVTAQAPTTFREVMLELGDTRHAYVPYTPVLPTMATKGAYNYSDLNRVEMVVEELSERWNLGLETRTNWTLWDVPTVSDMSRFRGNLATIGIECFGRDVIAGVPYDLSKMTYAHANRIEELLLSASNSEV